MNFLEAHRILSAFAGGPSLSFLFAMSGTADPFATYLAAAGAERGRTTRIRTLPFNTLGQALLGDRTDESEVYLLCPWDLVPETDWRSGLPVKSLDAFDWRERATETLSRLRARQASLVYLAAPLPPVCSSPERTTLIARWLEAEMRAAGATIVEATHFSLGAYLGSGCPVGSGHLGVVAQAAVTSLIGKPTAPAKVLVTDLDNTLWAGIIGDDGTDGIHFGPDGKGYPHFVYQTLLRQLREEGVLIAAVTKNDPEVAIAPFRAGRMVLAEGDLVACLASWFPKSAQIVELAERLNLGLDAFVFVDDNPVELAEVERALPSVQRVQFPKVVGELPAVLASLRQAFARETITAEDKERTAMYRRRLEGIAPRNVQGADLHAFLRDLDMRLTMHERSTGDRTRAVQLINKTNQFNLNGLRWSDAEVGVVLAAGGRLFTATLDDRTGTHGEILACLVDEAGRVRSLVMSCRVFQRRVEFAFLCWLAETLPTLSFFDYQATERNGPLRDFLAVLIGATPVNAPVAVDREQLIAQHQSDLALFRAADAARAP